MNAPSPEDLPREQLRERQWRSLRRLLHEIVPKNRFWTNKFKTARVDVTEIKSLEDLSQLPFSTKHELVDDQNQHPPYGNNLTYNLTAYSRLHQTSGTTGNPMRWLDTPATWNWFMDCWAQIFRIIELRPEDRFCFPFSFGPFIGFWAGFEGANRLGNLCIPAGGLSSEARLKLILDHRATILCCTPTYALRLAEVAEGNGIDIAASDVRAIVVAGEPGGSIPATRRRMEEAWQARVFDHWGMTDIGSLGIESVGDPASLLVLETECIAEIVDPESLKPVTPGEQGELVLTNLGRVGMPLIRYRTGDLVQAATTPNSCGRSLLRLDGGILGRADDMVTIRGNNVFPSSVEAVLRDIDDVAEFRVTVKLRQSMHHMTIEIEPTPRVSAGDEAELLLKRVSREIKDRLNFNAEIIGVEPESLPRFELKGKRFRKEF